MYLVLYVDLKEVTFLMNLYACNYKEVIALELTPDAPIVAVVEEDKLEYEKLPYEEFPHEGFAAVYVEEVTAYCRCHNFSFYEFKLLIVAG